MISMPYPTASTPSGGLLRPFQPCFGDAESAAKNDQLDALSLFGSLRGGGDYGTLLLVRTNYFAYYFISCDDFSLIFIMLISSG